MTKAILLSAMLCCSFLSKAQTIPNGGFENWTIDTAEVPDFWTITNTVPLGFPTIIKQTGAPLINNAVRIETAGGAGYRTQAGYIESRFPYTDSPSALTGLFKYDIKPGDTGMITVEFWKNGMNWYGGNFMNIYGTQTSLVPFTIPFLLVSKPDSVYIFISTSKMYPYTPHAGSYLMVDELKFTGATQQIPNGSLDSWSPVYLDIPADWVYYGTVSKTTDKYSGNYAMKLKTVKDRELSMATSYFPYTPTPKKDTISLLTGYYKTNSVGNFSGSVQLKLIQNGVEVWSGHFLGNLNQSTYTNFEIAIDNSIAADTLVIIAESSLDAGNEMFIDDLQFKQMPLNIKRIPSISHSIYPNPVHETLNIKLDGTKYRSAQVKVYDICGKLMLQKDYNLLGSGIIAVPVQDLPAGAYQYDLIVDGAIAENKFIKK
ncbi:MAG: hypothetical protein BGO70_01250 [Bacteroidetes bacterium 43-93]|uniref:T9SS type A sorting domain-containing protein n=1 Tax=uncultured Dysgonomonas sp. TaxID=206096 RepID=UPI00092CD604|nr:T9SS type A sorting domain-containing protein [uncultured Dysgonomonas sp.]MBN9483098.1 T9SS type A sorting domain-containing protein [Bacteroidota bacterium]OJW96337.1 MAG: hypothetical protein BGO70_01250 [Bacteroidetes bacterium 43-93]